jgi:EpsI family protein
MKFFSTLTGRLVITMVCLAATQAVAWKFEHQTRRQAGRVRELDVSMLPTQIGDWSGVDTEFDPRVAANVGASSIVNREYTDGFGRKVVLHMAEFPTAEISIPHPPPLCYSTAGWSLLRETSHERTAGARFRKMRLERDGARVDVTYWYQLGSRSAANRDDLRKVLQTLRWRGDPWPPMVKVLLHVPSDDPDEQAGAAIDQFSREVFDWIKSQS